MKLFIAIDSFKGSLSSASACRIAKRVEKELGVEAGQPAQPPAAENEKEPRPLAEGKAAAPCLPAAENEQKPQLPAAENVQNPQPPAAENERGNLPRSSETEQNFHPIVVEAVPVGDGGEGTKRAFTCQSGAKKKAAVITGKNGRKKQAHYLVSGGAAYLDAADCCGISVENRKEDALLSFTSYGLGELLLLAAKDGDVTELCIGLGGTGTVDGGAGLLAALGAEYFDAYGRKTGYLPSDLPYVKRCDFSALPSALNGKKLIVLCDTEAPLLGEAGAVALFAAQKGASTGGKRFLEGALAGFSACALQEVCRLKALSGSEKRGDVPLKSGTESENSAGGCGGAAGVFHSAHLPFNPTNEIPAADVLSAPAGNPSGGAFDGKTGAESVAGKGDTAGDITGKAPHAGGVYGKGTGAAGGLGFALLSVLGGEYKNGLSELFLRQNYEEKLREADAVISGEGWIDETSFTGKAVGKIAALCKAFQKPLYLVAGGIAPGTVLPEEVEGVFLLTGLCPNVFECMSRAEELFALSLRKAILAAARDFAKDFER